MIGWNPATSPVAESLYTSCILNSSPVLCAPLASKKDAALPERSYLSKSYIAVEGPIGPGIPGPPGPAIGAPGAAYSAILSIAPEGINPRGAPNPPTPIPAPAAGPSIGIAANES